MQLLTVENVADMLQLSRSKVYELKEDIGYLKVGGAVRFRPEDVFGFLDNCKVTGERARKPVPRPRLKHLQV